MNGWSLIEKQQPKVARFLVNSYLKERLVHAYVLEGPKGVGKLSVARNFAKMLLCKSSDKICGQCRHCQMIDSDGHVNVHLIRPDGQSIKKEQIQSLQAEFSKRAAENCAKVYIIEDADKMSSSASNSLLKFLEEPMADTYALLLTQNRQKLLPTIRSRSITLSFLALPESQLIKQFEEAGVAKFTALVAALTQNLDEARQLSQSETFSKLIELMLRTEECFVKATFDPSILIAEQQKLFKEKDSALLYLKLFALFYHDVLKMKIVSSPDLSFRMYPANLAASEEGNTTSDCVRKLSCIMEAEKRLLANANVLLCFDQLFLEMKGGVNYGI